MIYRVTGDVVAPLVTRELDGFAKIATVVDDHKALHVAAARTDGSRRDITVAPGFWTAVDVWDQQAADHAVVPISALDDALAALEAAAADPREPDRYRAAYTASIAKIRAAIDNARPSQTQDKPAGDAESVPA
ncbi:hypothetical protein [Dactylosporangium sp. CS-033363]|uniref:hypothetical protein n=1 Tax=Dactylosporangium sp. CS-033363 TaxID=3239935 RepID=UPI003D8A18A1